MISLMIPGPANLFLNGDDVSEDIRKWTINDVYNFIKSIPACSEYAQVGLIPGSIFYCLFLLFCCILVSITVTSPCRHSRTT